MYPPMEDLLSMEVDSKSSSELDTVLGWGWDLLGYAVGVAGAAGLLYLWGRWKGAL